MARITLIIPTFGAAGLLGSLFDSIRRQKFSDLEVVVVDGNSTDGTVDVVRQAGDLVTDWVSEPDNGIYDAVNKGLARANGDLIAVIGADDLLCENALNSVYHFWKQQPVDIIAGRAVMVDEHGSESFREDEDFGAGALLTGIPFCHNAMYATRQAYEIVGPYDVSYKLAADAHWSHRAIRAGLSCTRIDAPLVRFSLAGRSSKEGDRTMEESYRVVAENFPSLGLSEIKSLFGDIRGWTNTGAVEAILRRHPDAVDLHVAAALAFQQRARRLAAGPQPAPQTGKGVRSVIMKAFGQ